ncbi:MAG: recombination mediator RecR [Acidobacteriota bacterium]
MNAYPGPISRAIEELRKLPGIGRRTAQRLVLHLVAAAPGRLDRLAAALAALERDIRRCSHCHHLTDVDPCTLCTDPTREDEVICVVEQPSDLMAVEASGEYHGRYHVLHGVLDPLAGVGPDDLTVASLLQRIRREPVKEIILATNYSVEGEATAAYIVQQMQAAASTDLRISRPAQGIPAGAEVEYTDRLTLARALRGRRDFN